MAFFDALKALASQLIVLHHLAFYGPVSETINTVLPLLVGWLVDYGRLAVQVFLVIGGFFAAKALAPRGEARVGDPLALIWKRYCRLVVPFSAALGIAIVGAALAGLWLDDDAVPGKPGFFQVLSHLFLLHGVLGYESLSAGVWYVAIDFQLFALMVGLLWVSQRIGLRAYSPLLVGFVALASLFYFNRDAGWDNWSVYFFGSYALGAAAFWASERNRAGGWLVVMATIGLLALMLDFRIRIAVALVTALVLCLGRQTGWMKRWPDFRPVAFLGQISYSVFLVHFPVCLLANAGYARFFPDESVLAAAIFGLGAWAASIAAGAVFFRFVESRPLPDAQGLRLALAAVSGFLGKRRSAFNASRLRQSPSSPERV